MFNEVFLDESASRPRTWWATSTAGGRWPRSRSATSGCRCPPAARCGGWAPTPVDLLRPGPRRRRRPPTRCCASAWPRCTSRPTLARASSGSAPVTGPHQGRAARRRGVDPQDPRRRARPEDHAAGQGPGRRRRDARRRRPARPPVGPVGLRLHVRPGPHHRRRHGRGAAQHRRRARARLSRTTPTSSDADVEAASPPRPPSARRPEQRPDCRPCPSSKRSTSNARTRCAPTSTCPASPPGTKGKVTCRRPGVDLGPLLGALARTAWRRACSTAATS